MKIFLLLSNKLCHHKPVLENINSQEDLKILKVFDTNINSLKYKVIHFGINYSKTQKQYR